MKEIKRTETIEKIIGYKADDGTYFDSKEECEKYEKSAFFVVHERFKKLIVKEMSEYEMFIDYAVGSDEWIYLLLDIKSENDINVYNHFMQFTDGSEIIDETYIGKRILVGTGYDYDSWARRCMNVIGTIEDFKKRLEKLADDVFADKKGDTDETE